MPELSRAMLAGLPKNGPTDPIEYYRRPVVGWLYRERINIGLRLLKRDRYTRALEVGYSAGAVLLALAPVVDELHGLDLDAEPAPVKALLSRFGFSPKLVQGNVCHLPYPDAMFDLVVSFSVFEHVHDFQQGLAEVVRVLRPGGCFLLGMPAVNRMMEVGFRLIGFRGIEHHHVTSPQAVAACFAAAGLQTVGKQTLDVPLRGAGVHLYYTWLLEKVRP